jgi:hypothetical protein
MKSDVVRVLERELTQLEASLRANPTYIKIERIRGLLAAYGSDGGEVQVIGRSNHQSSTGPFERKSPNAPSKRSKVYDVVEEVIRSRGPTHRKDLLAEVTARRLMGTEKNPMQSIAIYLSDAKERFKSVGDGVWALRDRSEENIEAPAVSAETSE